MMDDRSQEKKRLLYFKLVLGPQNLDQRDLMQSIFVFCINRFLKSIFNVDGAIVIDDEVKQNFCRTSFLLCFGTSIFFTLLSTYTLSLYEQMVSENFERITQQLQNLKNAEEKIMVQTHRNGIWDLKVKRIRFFRFPCMMIGSLIGTYHGLNLLNYTIRANSLKYVPDNLIENIEKTEK